jgi:hypothetical protein
MRRVANPTTRRWVVRCFIDAIFKHSFGPGARVFVRPGDTDLTISLSRV